MIWVDLMLMTGRIMTVNAPAVLAVVQGESEGGCTVIVGPCTYRVAHSRSSVLRMIDDAEAGTEPPA